MLTLTNAAPATQTRPETTTVPTETKPVETIPANPDDPFGVDRKLIEEIEEIGRRYNRPGR